MIEFDLVGGPGDGRTVHVPMCEYPGFYDICCWDDFPGPIWARYTPRYDKQGIATFRFRGYVSDELRDGGCQCHLYEY